MSLCQAKAAGNNTTFFLSFVCCIFFHFSCFLGLLFITSAKASLYSPFVSAKQIFTKVYYFVWFWVFFFLVTLQREEGSILPCLPVTGGGRICVLNCDQRHVWTRTRTPWRRGLCTHTGFMQLYLHRFRTKQLKSCRLQRNIGLHLQMGFRPEQLILLYESGYITCGITASSQC